MNSLPTAEMKEPVNDFSPVGAMLSKLSFSPHTSICARKYVSRDTA